MKVKLIESSGYMHLTVGKEYEVRKADKLHHTHYAIYNDVGCVGYYERRWFEVVKNGILVIKTLKDLNGLENGTGGYIEYSSINDCAYILCNKEEKFDIACSGDYSNLDNFFTVLKSMGFKFEYKPLRKKEEVLEEMKGKAKPFIFNDYNYYINYIKQDNKYYVTYDCFNNPLGTLYFSKDLANKYCVELNEIEKASR
ncbi:hypothetical protein [Cetobacterium sp.]|uniref:hypothetical protein n=1 Tax=Cetobacterium sp. TaxID=2071632 RepID=UPI003EE72D07